MGATHASIFAKYYLTFCYYVPPLSNLRGRPPVVITCVLSLIYLRIRYFTHLLRFLPNILFRPFFRYCIHLRFYLIFYSFRIRTFPHLLIIRDVVYVYYYFIRPPFIYSFFDYLYVRSFFLFYPGGYSRIYLPRLSMI